MVQTFAVHVDRTPWIFPGSMRTDFHFRIMITVHKQHRDIQHIQNVFQVIIRQVTTANDQVDIREHFTDILAVDPVYNLITQSENAHGTVGFHLDKRVPDNDKNKKAWRLYQAFNHFFLSLPAEGKACSNQAISRLRNGEIIKIDVYIGFLKCPGNHANVPHLIAGIFHSDHVHAVNEQT